MSYTIGVLESRIGGFYFLDPLEGSWKGLICNKGIYHSAVSMKPCRLQPPVLQTPSVNLELKGVPHKRGHLAARAVGLSMPVSHFRSKLWASTVWGTAGAYINAPMIPHALSH